MKKINISYRINKLINIPTHSFSEVWDLCCDHGKIGIAYAQLHSPKKIYFIDQVESIIANLSKDLSQYLPIETSFETQVLSAEKITINQESESLIIIAGVGSETIISALKSLHKKGLKNTKILVSAHKHPHKLRKYLITQKFRLIKEVLVYEGRQFYEMLYIDLNHINNVTLVGDEMWNYNDFKHLEYCNQLLRYYELKLKNGIMEYSVLFDELMKVKQKFIE